MKKLVALIIAGMMALTMVACGGSKDSSEPTTTATDSADSTDGATDDAGAADTDTSEEAPAE